MLLNSQVERPYTLHKMKLKRVSKNKDVKRKVTCTSQVV